MQLLTRTLRFLANRYLADPHRPTQNLARANAAEACAILRQRRQEQDDVDAYLRARRLAQHRVSMTGTSQGSGAEYAS